MSKAALRIDSPPDVVPFLAPVPGPVTWLLRWHRAVAEGDRPLEAAARRELRQIGYRVAVDRRNRKGVSL